jgi:hypothetical protein
MRIWGFVGAVTAVLLALGLTPSARAQSQTENNGLPGQALFTYYETTEPFTECGTTSADADGCNNGGNGTTLSI